MTITIQEAEQFMERYQRAYVRYVHQTQRLDRLRAESERGSGGGQLDGMPHGSGKSDPTGNYGVRLTIQEQIAEQRRAGALAIMDEIDEVIDQVEDARQADFLRLKYVNFRTLATVSRLMGLSGSYVRRVLKPAALESVAEIISDSYVTNDTE